MIEPCDVVGVGFGPANLALAIAIEEAPIATAARFLEAQADPLWQGGMLLAGSNIQNHPCRDLVSLRNPRSRYSFINYLFEHGRLIDHLNLPMEFPLRKEYAAYIRWVTRQFAHLADFGTRVSHIGIEKSHGEQVYVVRTADGSVTAARAMVLGCGRTPLIPPPFDAVGSPAVVHLTGYLPAVTSLAKPPRAVAVIGGSQSAVELTLDLTRRFPEARVINYLRAFGPRLKDTSPFSEEGFFPDFTEYYFKASRASKRVLDAAMRPTNYSSVDADVLHELYVEVYEQRLDGKQRIYVRGNRQVESVAVNERGVALGVRELHTGVAERDEVDLVVLATGFRDLGPADNQEPYPPLLSGIIDRFQFDGDGYLVVNSDYSLQPIQDGTPPLFLNGLCESTHGIGDAGSFSLLSLRAETIRNGLRKRLGTDVAANRRPPYAVAGRHWDGPRQPLRQKIMHNGGAQ